MQIALPNLNMQSMSLSGPASGGYAHQLGSVNPMFPGQAMYAPSHGAPSGEIQKRSYHSICIFSLAHAILSIHTFLCSIF